MSSGMGSILAFVQIFFIIVIGLYFWNLLRGQQGNKNTIERESRKEMEKLRKMRDISLTVPLAEKTRPAHFQEIIGQEEGLKALRAALCGPNPQHVIIYGPPGVGKTAAARLVLDEAKKCKDSPFAADAKFVEVDGATARFDERGIADPLIGSVHDPIYQGAGAMGMAGIPQPKSGAVTKAHGGILFIDEIGELHSIQINKLLKVLEDRKVMLESAYYSSEDTNIPPHIHDIFQNGLPADFRLVAATTRLPEEIPPAIRSRCVEIFFRPLLPHEIALITKNAVQKMNMEMEDEALQVVTKYATNGREAVNIVQIAAGAAINEGIQKITLHNVEWVINNGQHDPRPDKKVPDKPQVGLVNGLAVAGPNIGMLLELETIVTPVAKGQGQIIVTGVVDEEEVGGGSGKKLRRKSLVKSSVENVLTLLRNYLNLQPKDYDIHVNFPGGIPIDGPSAGVTIATALYSAITGIPVDNRVAMTGEVSIRGYVKPVGGIVAKVEAARLAGAKRVIIPKDNWQQAFQKYVDFQVIGVERFEEILALALIKTKGEKLTVPSYGKESLNPVAFAHNLQEISF
ncbi:MAG: ATP-dependent protease LonB [Bacillota bacterium]|jgi:Lon-like ATP-dependent protease